MATMGQHGDGTITARRDGRLQVAVTMLDRRREFAYVPKSLVRRDPKAAARMAERLRDELLERRDAELEPGRQTLAAYLRSWLTSLEQAKRRKVRPRTLEHYRLIVEAHIIPALGAVRLDRLREPAVQRWLDGMDGSPRSVMHRRAVLRRAYNVAQRKRLVVHNPAIAVELPEDDWAGGNPLSFDEARRLLQATADTRLGALWRLALDTGLREGELLGLGWTHLDPDARTVTLEAQLQRINRAWVRVPPKADRSLGAGDHGRDGRRPRGPPQTPGGRARPEWTFWGLIFLTEAGEPYHRRAILREFHAACDAAGIERRRFHDLRASTAHLMSEAGVAEDVRMQRLGHATQKMARRYAGSSEAVVDAVDAVRRAVQEGAGMTRPGCTSGIRASGSASNTNGSLNETGPRRAECSGTCSSTPLPPDGSGATPTPAILPRSRSSCSRPSSL
jgi:integrase